MPRKPASPFTKASPGKAEKVLTQKQRKPLPTRSDRDIQEQSQDLSVQKIELQNDEVRGSAAEPAELGELHQLEVFKRCIDVSPDLVFQIDAEGQLLYVNDSASNALGYSRQELLRMAVYDIDSVLTARRWTEVWPIIKSRGTFTDQRTYRRRDASEFPVEVTTSYFNISGREFHWAFAKDITDRKKAEAALSQSEAKLSRAFYGSASAFGISAVADGRFFDVNQSFLEVFGYTRDEVIGRTARELHLWSDLDQRARLMKLLKEQGQVRNFEHQFRAKTGEVYYGLMSAAIIEINGIDCLITEVADITHLKKAEEALRQSEERLRTLNEAVFEGVAVFEEERFVDVNDQFGLMLGYDRAELIGMRAEGLVHDEDREWVMENIRLGRESIVENRMIRKDGRVIIIEAHGKTTTQEGRQRRTTAVRDITDRKRMEEELRSSEEAARAILNASPETMFLIDVSGIVLAANTTSAHRLGVEPHELIGRCVYDFLPADVAQKRRATDEEVVRTGAPIAFEDERMGQHYFTGAYPVFNEARKVTRLVVFSNDITARKHTEEELRRSHDEMELRVKERTAELHQSRERFQTLVDLLPEAVFEVDLRGTATYANRQALQYTGRTFEELDRGDLDMRDVIVEKDRPRANENVRKILGREVRQGADYTIRRKDGSEFPAFIRASRIDRNGETVGLRGIMIDITGPRRAEAERARLEEQLHQAVKMQAIGTLAGGIAHDFNNMLAVIIGNAELALDDEDLEGIRANLDQILSASKRSRELVRQILTFGRKREGQRKAFRLTPLIGETAQLLRGSLPSTVRIRTDIRTSSDTIMGDASQIQQVLMNLATNAAHAMAHEGTLAIRVSDKTLLKGQKFPDHDLSPGRYLKLTVRDTGTGIPAEIRERIFDPFFTTKDPGQGTGMGLAVVYGIAKSHGGTIIVSSKVGKGSIFTVFLPAATEPVTRESIGQSPLPRGNERVLVVDDEASVVAVVTETLKRLGYEVTGAFSGTEGWKRFAHGPSRYDLVITDHIMPEITGVQLAERMLGLRSDLPIILSTGYSEAVSREEARSVGISEFLMKPVERTVLAEVVRRVLDSRNK